ncbi:MAG: hypothetical protein K9M08_15680 [Pirellula sp.]|jgi:hypothetical protein|nr:hypothetical protein [Pirellula sp.]
MDFHRFWLRLLVEIAKLAVFGIVKIFGGYWRESAKLVMLFTADNLQCFGFRSITQPEESG